MNLMVVAVILFLLAGLLAVLKARSTSKGDSLSFDRREPLFSPAERSFLGILEQALNSKYRILGKVRLGDLVKPAKGLSNSKRVSGLNKVNQKHIDFVVCSATDLAVVGVVELDDQSHGREDRAERDVFVDHTLGCAGIPIARFSAKKGYQIQEVRTKLAEAFKLSISVPVTSSSSAHDSVQPMSVSEPSPVPATAVALPETKEASPNCEKCGAVMVRRQAKKGPHAGKFFWACSTFPKCRQAVAISEV
ncbi:DUF2726 domain-containing protein [Citrifermentans bremense]|uniref:DUF2726 domain-containing protein n=1 Tax=Citrifermentans bremense TaxID=60035 RepID=UPI00047919FA|nr:DUF2726 domain-containing protein [Citrifermentans bremense]